MIVQVRGTNGAGKSTLVRRVMDRYERKVSLVDREGRAYGLDHPMAPSLLVPIQVENEPTEREVRHKDFGLYALLGMAGAQVNVLFEGRSNSHDAAGLFGLTRRCEVVVIDLSTSIEECIASSNATSHRARRKVRWLYGAGQDFNQLLRELRVDVRRLDREQAYRLTCELLGLPSEIAVESAA